MRYSLSYECRIVRQELSKLQKNVSDEVCDFECTRMTNVVDCQVQPTVASGLVLRLHRAFVAYCTRKKKSLEREPERL